MGLIQRESLSKVDAANLDIVPKFMRGTRAEDPPFGNDVSAVGYA
jgi:hypothetical protein